MSVATAPVLPPTHDFCAGEPRRVIFSDPAGERLGEMPLETCDRGDRFPARDATAQLMVATSPNWLDRPSTGDALHVVIGMRACFGYAVDIDRVRWFSHPRLVRADASSLPDRELRTLLYNLHSDDPAWVSEIIWETSGPISAHKVPALPAAIDPALERSRDGADYWRAIGRLLPRGGRRAVPVIPAKCLSASAVSVAAPETRST